VSNFSVNIEFLDYTLDTGGSFSINIESLYFVIVATGFFEKQ